MALAEKIHKIQMKVDKAMAQFYTGSVHWFPQIQIHYDCINYWHCIPRMKMGVLTSKNTIKKFSIKIGEYSGHYVPPSAALDKLKMWLKGISSS